MVKLPFRKKEKPPLDVQKELKIEGGLTKIEGAQFLKQRVATTTEEIDELLTDYTKMLTILLKKRDPTLYDKQQIEELKLALENWRLCKMVVRSATPWLRSGESTEMSRRYGKFCQFFGRNHKKAQFQELITMASLYIHGISHMDKDVEPAPTIWVQVPVSHGYGGDVNADVEKDRETD